LEDSWKKKRVPPVWGPKADPRTERSWHVEDREKITPSEPEVEAHRRKAKATDEGTTEGESEEDTELHARRVKLANEEASGEADDVELHAKKKL
jgi:hypothetical protein